eukprot:TRINITY_DN620_c0_g3_i2.p1 TRINITY_DN620_c0_g3~~TRINITY_DN620_c0_g3_i2.p1  ORF type:complete len:727 (+),score=188.46 TRINITY_DN620_c0_g3_i2:143-2323(+)
MPSRLHSSASIGSRGCPRKSVSLQPESSKSAPVASSDVAACVKAARRISVHGDIKLQRQTYSTARKVMEELRTAESEERTTELEAPPDADALGDLGDLHIGLPVSPNRRSLLRQASMATRIGAAKALQDKMKLSDQLARTVLAAKGMDRLEQELAEFDLSETMREQLGEIFQCVKELGIRDPAPIVNQISQLFLRHELVENLDALREELEKELKELEKASVGLQLASELAKHHAKLRPIKDKLMASAQSLWVEVKYRKAFGKLHKAGSEKAPAPKPMAAPPDRQQQAHWRQLRAQREIASRLRRDGAAKERPQPARWRQLRTQREIAARLRRDGAGQPVQENENIEVVPTNPSGEAGAAAAESPSACLQRSSSVATAASGEAAEPLEDSAKLSLPAPEWMDHDDGDDDDDDDDDDDHDDDDDDDDDDDFAEALAGLEESEHGCARLAIALAHESGDAQRSGSSNTDKQRGSEHEKESELVHEAGKTPDRPSSGSDMEEDEEVEQDDTVDQPVSAAEAATAQSRPSAKRKRKKELGAPLLKLVHREEIQMSTTFNSSSSSWGRPSAPFSMLSRTGSFQRERLRFPPLLSIQLPTCESRSAAIRRTGKRAQGDIELETIQLNWDSKLQCAKRHVEMVHRPKLPWLVEEQRCPSMAFGSSISHFAAEYQTIEVAARDLGQSSKVQDACGHDELSAMRPQGMFKKLIEVKDEGPSFTGFCRFHRSLKHLI